MIDINLFKIYSGILTREQAFTGPVNVQIDITNQCNNTCLYCWARSPLLKDKIAGANWQRQTIPYEKIISVLDELKKLGVKHIHFSGGGEPSKHPRFLDLIRYVKKLDFELELTTNFTLMTEPLIKELTVLPINYLTASFWTANSDTYLKLHPGQPKNIFSEMEKNLRLLCKLKQKKRLPVVRVVFVISNENYLEIKEMLEFCESVGVDHILFQVMDAVPDRTETLLLNSSQKKELKILLNQNKDLIKKLEQTGKTMFEFDNFERRLQSETSVSGNYDGEITKKIPCYCGWVFSRITADGNVNFCFKTDEYPMGNIYKNTFTEIWRSKKYNDFRRDRFYKKTEANMKLRCDTVCDNIMDNIYWHNKFDASEIKNNLAEVFKKFFDNIVYQKKKSALSEPKKNNFKNLKDFIGLQTKTIALNAPFRLSICPTSRCNTSCVCCWSHSQLRAAEERAGFAELEYDILKPALEYCLQNGTNTVFLTGGGEPTIYPDIEKIILFVNKFPDKQCDLNTNFIRFADDAKFTEFILNNKINSITASILAGSEESYAAIHPRTKPEVFKLCMRTFEHINKIKNNDSHRIIYNNIIFKLNYNELETMVKIAEDTGCFAVRFSHIHSTMGFADHLRLNLEEAEKLYQALFKIKNIYVDSGRVNIIEFEDFFRRTEQLLSVLKNPENKKELEYDKLKMSNFNCSVGWSWAQINQDGGVSSCCRIMTPRGNIKTQSFAEIWNGTEQKKFRALTINLSSEKIRLNNFPCSVLCDNLLDVEMFESRIKQMSETEKIAGKLLAKSLSIFNKLKK